MGMSNASTSKETTMTATTKRKVKQTAKHAPGPWTNDYGGTAKGQTCTDMGCGYGKSQIVDAKGRAIAGVAAVEPNDGPMYRDGCFSQETFDCLHATAALIAAAPELLQVAIDALKISDSDIRNRGLSAGDMVRERNWNEELRVVIAKTRGIESKPSPMHLATAD